MAFFGPDFYRARREWLYPTEPMQGFWRGIGLFVLLFVVFEMLIVPILGAVIAEFVFGQSVYALMTPDGVSPLFMQGFIAGKFPAMLLLCLLSWGLVQRGLPRKQGRLPLGWPRLGVGGTLVLLGAFLIFVLVLLGSAFWLMGVDPASTQGLVEKSIMGAAGDNWHFLLIVPGIVLGAPVAEEILFRGYLFAALEPTRIGRTGAVLITSALWALAHAGPAPWAIVGGIFLMGIVLGLILLRFGSLWVTIACHAAWNMMSSLSLFGVGTSP